MFFYLVQQNYLRSYSFKKVQSGGEEMALLKIKQVFLIIPAMALSREETEAQSLNL